MTKFYIHDSSFSSEAQSKWKRNSLGLAFFSPLAFNTFGITPVWDKAYTGFWNNHGATQLWKHSLWNEYKCQSSVWKLFQFLHIKGGHSECQKASEKQRYNPFLCAVSSGMSPIWRSIACVDTHVGCRLAHRLPYCKITQVPRHWRNCPEWCRCLWS